MFTFVTCSVFRQNCSSASISAYSYTFGLSSVSYYCTLLQPFDGCHLAGTLPRSNHIVLDGNSWSRGKRNLRVKLSPKTRNWKKQRLAINHCGSIDQRFRYLPIYFGLCLTFFSFTLRTNFLKKVALKTKILWFFCYRPTGMIWKNVNIEFSYKWYFIFFSFLIICITTY